MDVVNLMRIGLIWLISGLAREIGDTKTLPSSRIARVRLYTRLSSRDCNFHQ